MIVAMHNDLEGDFLEDLDTEDRLVLQIDARACATVEDVLVVSPRPHDTGLVTLVSQHQSEFALHARAILGLPVDTSLRGPGASAVIYGGLEARAVAFDGVAEALAVPQTELRLFGKPESFKKRRMGVALACGADTDEARARAQQAAAAVPPTPRPHVPSACAAPRSASRAQQPRQ